jgi:hypothetical protein
MSGPQDLAGLADRVVDGLEELVVAGRRRLAALEARREELEREIAAQTRQLRTWEAAQRSLRPPIRPTLLSVAPDTGIPTKREAVLAYLTEAPDSVFKLVDIRRALVERAWMNNDKSSIHALEVAVIEMAERGELRRVRKGYYKLGSLSESDSPPLVAA